MCETDLGRERTNSEYVVYGLVEGPSHESGDEFVKVHDGGIGVLLFRPTIRI